MLSAYVSIANMLVILQQVHGGRKPIENLLPEFNPFGMKLQRIEIWHGTMFVHTEGIDGMNAQITLLKEQCEERGPCL